MVTIDRDLEIGSWLDLGMFVQTFLIAAQAHDLDSCPQAIFARFHPAVRRELGIPESEVVVCGIALGKADPDAPANRLVPEREPVEGFTSWLDRTAAPAPLQPATAVYSVSIEEAWAS